MYTLKLTNGDLDLSDRRGKVLTGSEKLIQSLGLWIAETAGVDRFHPSYGSNLQNMVGSPSTQEFKYRVEAEIARVVNLYIEQQSQQFEKHPENFSKAEVIIQVLLVTSYFVGQSLWCTVYVKTMANTTAEISTEVI